MKIWSVIIGVGLVACSPSKPSQQQEPVVVTSCDSTVTISPKASFTIKLPITMGTGFDWYIAAQSNPALLLPPPQEVVTQNHLGIKDGEQDTQIITLTAAGTKGRDTLTLHYRRAFEKNKAPEKVCTVTVIVK